jgi:hypothetical protein
MGNEPSAPSPEHSRLLGYYYELLYGDFEDWTDPMAKYRPIPRNLYDLLSLYRRQVKEIMKNMLADIEKRKYWEDFYKK